MKNDKNDLTERLPNRNAPRRSMLTKLVAGGAALSAVSLGALAAEREGKGKGKGKGKGGEKGRGPGRQGDPTAMAAKMIKEFDLDGDNALNAKELAAAMTAMRQRRGGGAGERPARGQGKGKGDRGGSQNGSGVKPKRPSN